MIVVNNAPHSCSTHSFKAFMWWLCHELCFYLQLFMPLCFPPPVSVLWCLHVCVKTWAWCFLFAVEPAEHLCIINSSPAVFMLLAFLYGRLICLPYVVYTICCSCELSLVSFVVQASRDCCSLVFKIATAFHVVYHLRHLRQDYLTSIKRKISKPLPPHYPWVTASQPHLNWDWASRTRPIRPVHLSIH